jgi:hypothetical protein
VEDTRAFGWQFYVEVWVYEDIWIAVLRGGVEDMRI